MTSSASTNSVMRVMIQSRKLWNQMMLSITGVADSCSVDFPRRGLTQFGERRPAGRQRNACYR